MRDQDQQYPYPRHQPGRSEKDHHDPFASDTQSEGELEEGRSPAHQRDKATTPMLPRRHVRNSLIIGAIVGLLVALQGAMLVLLNASIYREAGKYLKNPGAMPSNVALAVFGITVLSIAIGTILYFIGGLIIGRVAIHRRWAFIGGFVGGVVSWLVSAGLKWLPSYPDAGNTGFGGGALGLGAGLVAALIGIIILGVLSGAFSLLGAWLATRRHPYYVGYAG